MIFFPHLCKAQRQHTDSFSPLDHPGCKQINPCQSRAEHTHDTQDRWKEEQEKAVLEVKCFQRESILSEQNTRNIPRFPLTLSLLMGIKQFDNIFQETIHKGKTCMKIKAK